MKKLFYIRVLLVVMSLAFMSCSKEEDIINDNSLYPDIEAWFKYLCSPELGGRSSGSVGIKSAEKYICEIIGRSDSLSCDTFKSPAGEMTNIIFHVKGESDSLIVIGAHYDAWGYGSQTPFPGADDNLSGVAVLLRTIKMIQSSSIHPHYSFDFCFFDGEEIGRYGSKRYVANCRRGILVYMNVDTCGNPNLGLYFAYSGYSPDLAHDFLEKQEVLNFSIIEEYNPVGYTTDCEPFEASVIPFMFIANDAFSSYQHTINDDVSHISFSRIDRIAKSLVNYLKTK